MTPKPNGLRAPGEKTPQGLKDSSKQGHRTKDFIIWTPFRVNTYALLGTNTQLNQRIFIYFSFQTYLIIFRINTKVCLGQSPYFNLQYTIIFTSFNFAISFSFQNPTLPNTTTTHSNTFTSIFSSLSPYGRPPPRPPPWGGAPPLGPATTLGPSPLFFSRFVFFLAREFERAKF